MRFTFYRPEKWAIYKRQPKMFRFIKSQKNRYLLLLFALTLTGCVWLRLLEIKYQLADFDENVRVEQVQKHFVLHLKNPVLLSDDFVYLSKLRPSRTEQVSGGGYRWYLDFTFNPAKTPEQKTKKVSFCMTYTADHKLSSFDFSPLFLEMAPAQFLEASIRSLGAGKIDQEKRQLKVDPQDLPKLNASLPKMAQVKAVLGPPVEEATEEGLKVLIYRFNADSLVVDNDYMDRREAEAMLYFDPAKDDLVRLKGKFAGLKLSIDYRKLQEQSAAAGATKN